MNNTISSNSLRNFFKTTRDITDFLEVIEDLRRLFFNTALPFQEILDKHVSYTNAHIIKKLAPEYNSNPEDKQEIGSFLSRLQEALSALPLIALTLPIQPTQEFIDSLSNWFYMNYQKTVILDIRYDPLLLGGAVVSCKGKYRDYSLRKQIQPLIGKQNLVIPTEQQRAEGSHTTGSVNQIKF